MLTSYEVRETVLRIEDVSLALGGMPVLKGVKLEIKDIVGHGQVLAVLGPSGIGKTQLFRILSGLNRPDKGKVLLNAKGTQVAPGMVGVVTQDYRLLRHRTVLGNLLVAGRQLKPKLRARLMGEKPRPNPITGSAPLTEKAIRDRAVHLLESLGLSGQLRKYPRQLSGGQRQRVAIAQQLMCSENFLLMDEPFSGLDYRTKLNVCELITQVAAFDELNTIVITTHDIDTALLIADRVVIMGRERDAAGAKIPGAYFVEDHDIAAQGLAWHRREEIETSPEFLALSHRIKKKFELEEL